MPQQEADSMTSRQTTRWIVLAVLFVAVAAAGWYFSKHDPRDLLASSQVALEGIGAWAMVLLGVAYIVACVLLIPGSLLTLVAGALFGVVRGTVVVSIASTLGATAAFLVGRYLTRDSVESRVSSNPKFQAVDSAVGEHGFKIVLLTRLSPVFHFNLLNYAFGLTRVSLRDYVLGSWIGMLPGTVMYIYLGSAFKNLAELAAGRVEGGIWGQTLFGVGLVATIVVTVFVTRIARRALADTSLSADITSVSDMGATHA
jgi:uncharacterized membrane protein YdjX (TVP38/TMEM64 family)